MSVKPSGFALFYWSFSMDIDRIKRFKRGADKLNVDQAYMAVAILMDLVPEKDTLWLKRMIFEADRRLASEG